MKYILGTAQFGLDYGISNSSGEISDEELKKILVCAKQYGVRYLDTANVYGNAESRIGEMFELTREFGLITKTTHMDSKKSLKSNITLINVELEKSLKKLKRTSVDVLLIHNVEDLSGKDSEEIFRALEKIKASGLAKKIGVSVYSVDEAEEFSSKYLLDVLQFPISAFDQTFDRSGILKRLKKRGIELHARSIFLQGLLLMNFSDIHSYFEPIMPLIQRYKEQLQSVGLNKIDGALNYIKQVKEIDAVIFGVQNKNQLAATLDSLKSSPKLIDYKEFAVSDRNIINPSMWQI